MQKNTDELSLSQQVVYNNFDRLEVTFQAKIPDRAYQRLLDAKEIAQETRDKQLVLLGSEKVLVDKKGIGCYGISADTGEDGEIWQIRNSKKDPWNIRVVVKSAAFIGRNFQEIKQRLYDRLEAFGARITGTESVGRVDYAIDFVDPYFEIDHKNFVAHSSASPEFYEGEEPWIKPEIGQKSWIKPEMKHRTSGGRTQTATIGKMPGRQLTIYNKSKEIISSKKSYWRDVWGLDEGVKVWRLEMRAGKEHLKDSWGVATFQELEQKIGDIFRVTLEKIRYLRDRNENKKVTRCKNHSLWGVAEGIIKDIFAHSIRGLMPNQIKKIVTQEFQKSLVLQLGGLATSTSYIHGIGADSIDSIVDVVTDLLRKYQANDPARIHNNILRAQSRYVFLDQGEMRHAA